MSLSVCCLAGYPGPLVRAVLEPLRDVADEIVVAADSRLDEATLAEYALVADRLLRLEFEYTCRHIPWLHAQCSCDWILRLDTDELLSPALLRALPGLLADDGVEQYWLPRRWPFPDATSWLDEPPWWPDYQLRLVRNNRHLRFADGQLHVAGALSQEPAAYLEMPLYHLIFLLNDRAQREESAARYEAMRPGLTMRDGSPFNQRYYLPESAGALELSKLPDEDRRAIERVLAVVPISEGKLERQPALTTKAESDLYLEGLRPFDKELFRAKISSFEKEFRLPPATELWLFFRVENVGLEPWQMFNPLVHPGRQVRISYRWLEEDGSLRDDGVWTWLPRRLDPGTSTVVPVTVRTPEKAGSHVLEVDLLHEQWFGCAVRVPVEVGRRPVFREDAVRPRRLRYRGGRLPWSRSR